MVDFYNETLDFGKLRKLKIRENTLWNYSYFPIIFENEEILLKVQSVLNESNIFPRRYFYPSLNTLEFIKAENMPISENISKCILCLPLYVGLSEIYLNKIVTLINQTL